MGLFLSTELAARALGVEPATIRQWAHRRKLTRFGTPGRARYSIRELTDLLIARAGVDQGQPPVSRSAQ